MTNPIPEGHQTLVPHLTVRDATKAIAFYQAAFGAELAFPPSVHGGKVAHATLRLGDCVLFLNDAFGEPPPTPAGVCINICTEDADALFDRAVKAGARPAMPMADTFWGDRYGQVEDPFGQRWAVATRIRDVPPEELERVAAEFFKNSEPPKTS